jgi:hypothetical protein
MPLETTRRKVQNNLLRASRFKSSFYNPMSQHAAAASLAQLVARRSHNPKVVSSILTGGIFFLGNHLGWLKSSDTGTRTQVARVKAEYPNQLDYIGSSVDEVIIVAPLVSHEFDAFFNYLRNDDVYAGPSSSVGRAQDS